MLFEHYFRTSGALCRGEKEFLCYGSLRNRLTEIIDKKPRSRRNSEIRIRILRYIRIYRSIDYFA